MSLKKYLKGKFDWDVSGLAAYVDEQREDLIVKSVTEARTLQYVSIQQGIKGSQELTESIHESQVTSTSSFVTFPN